MKPLYSRSFDSCGDYPGGALQWGLMAPGLTNASTAQRAYHSQILNWNLLKLKGNWIACLLGVLSCKWSSHIIWCKNLSICIGISLESANRSPECGAKIWEFTQRLCAFAGWCARADRVQSVQKGETWWDSEDMRHVGGSEGCVGYDCTTVINGVLGVVRLCIVCVCGAWVKLWKCAPLEKSTKAEISQLLQVASVALSRIWKCFGLRPSLSFSFEV